MARVLMDLGLPEEALDVITQLPPPPDEAFAWGLLRTRAALASGLVAATETAIEAIRKAELGADQRQDLKDLEGLLDQSIWPGMKSWDTGRDWVWRCIEEGQPGQAAVAFARSLSCLRAKSALRGFEEVCETAITILRLADTAAALTVLIAMADLFEQLGEAKAMWAVLARLRGREMPFMPRANWIDPKTRWLLRSCLAEACAASGRWRDAVARFEAPPTAAVGFEAETLCELARCVGQVVLSEHRPAFAEPRTGRVFDMFPFNGEFVMLEMKLAEMGGWVDGFILVEAAETFTGMPKPLYFAENKERFAAHADKIVHICIDRFPDHLRTAWAREFFQRDNGVAGLWGRCAPSDVVIISDVDEIIREDAVRGMTDALTGAELRLFNFFLNCEVLSDRPPVKTVFARAGLLAEMGASYLRLGSVGFRPKVFAPNAGWHFSSVGSAAELARKLSSYSHTEWAHQGEAELAERLAQVRGGEIDGLAVRELDDGLPAFIRDNRERLAELLL
jgi:beta-1,4-mannosyl-glycoprotein beta-1,4-N-acetylglucosaminyltransferase